MAHKTFPVSESTVLNWSIAAITFAGTAEGSIVIGILAAVFTAIFGFNPLDMFRTAHPA